VTTFLLCNFLNKNVLISVRLFYSHTTYMFPNTFCHTMGVYHLDAAFAENTFCHTMGVYHLDAPFAENTVKNCILRLR